MDGKQRTLALKTALTTHYISKNFSCSFEIGLLPWGRRKCDFLAINMKREILIAEVKQSISDFRNDKKWTDYLPFCNKFYFCIPSDLYVNHKSEILDKISLQPGVGLIVVNDKGKCKVIKNAKKKKMKKACKSELILKLAWKNGKHRGNTKRLYLKWVTL